MRISINLASKPFVELRPLFARLRLIIAGLSVLAILLGIGVSALSSRARQASVQMDQLKAQTQRVQAATAANAARMRRPENQGVLERSRFLNTLFARKSFSWTAVMMDLERVLPNGVQVTSIDPVISKEGAVSIRLRVTGDRDKTIQLVKNLEHSRSFVSPRLAGETALTAEKAKALSGAGTAGPSTAGPGAPRNVSLTDDAVGNGVEFEILSGYNELEPRVKTSEKHRAKVVADDGGDQ